MTREAPPTHTTLPAAGTLVIEEPRFAIVPEWVIDAAVPDGAFRLYSLLLRYGNGSGSRMPSRQTLARRLRRSVDAVDWAMRNACNVARHLKLTPTTRWACPSSGAGWCPRGVSQHYGYEEHVPV